MPFGAGVDHVAVLDDELALRDAAQHQGGAVRIIPQHTAADAEAVHIQRVVLGADNSIRIDNPAGDDSFLQQTVTVKPKTRYRLTGYLKTKDVVVKSTGANISLAGGFDRTEAFSGKQNWKKVSFEFDTGGMNTIKIGPRLGHYSSMAMGTAWFDDLQLIELGPSRKR
ncbi:MAG: hypothetical protein J0L73_14130 [Verrucomicrobia bacterium]|nr:hypothetical protein [Verrucomicrobiota bacterium]